jgi:hypothetical protein
MLGYLGVRYSLRSTIRNGSSRADTVLDVSSQPHLHLFATRQVPLPYSLAAGAMAPVSYRRSFGSGTQRIAAIGIVREVLQFSGFSGLATAMAAMSRLPGEETC